MKNDVQATTTHLILISDLTYGSEDCDSVARRWLRSESEVTVSSDGTAARADVPARRLP